MIAIRPAEERGVADYGWLDTRYSFSFADYHDPRYMGFRALRVINDDRIAPSGGFPTHGHRDMEIVTYVLDGALEHKDSLGSGGIVKPGGVQRMSAGTGIRHSEYNPSSDEALRLLQIWILPERAGLQPEYEQRDFPIERRRGRLCPIAAPDGRDGAFTIHQDVAIFAAVLAPSESVRHELAPDRFGWIQMAKGAMTVNGQQLREGDGAAFAEEPVLSMVAATPAEFLLFDLA
jgi:hypothetical protein